MANLPKDFLVAGRYRLDGTLGRGGMGAVFRAVDQSTGRRIALKLLTGDGNEAHLDGYRLKFRHEFHTLATLHHPCIVEVFDYGLDGNRPFYTMELLEGLDVRDLAPVPPKEACSILRDAAAALAFLHARRLVHRDLSPRNVRCVGHRAKLIDFGALVSAGATSSLVMGTPPCVAPEAIHHAALDHRTDLFALGAVAYWLLTRTHAFPAKRIDDLPNLWRQRPRAPSTLSPQIPRALDELVLALLSFEPFGRPSSAAEVIDRLGAIGELDPLEAPEVSRGYLVSQALVGRNEEMQDIRQRLAQAKEGRGSAVVIEAESGAGKSRLLREIALESKLSGSAQVLLAEATSGDQAPYAVLRALLREALANLPEETKRTAEPYAPEIFRALPELAERLELTNNKALSIRDLQEGRARIQAALSSWLCALASAQSLVIIVDDLQRADEGSLAVLASVIRETRERRILFVAGFRSDEAPRALASTKAVLDMATHLPLSGLDEVGVRELLEETFGEVPNLVRLARTIYQTVGGKPLSCLELVRYLVDSRVIQCAEGVWILPEDISDTGVPHTLEDAVNARIQALDPNHRQLGQLLALHGPSFTLQRVLELAPDETASFRALDDLVRQEILNDEGARYRFRHDGFREGLLRSLDDAEKIAMHRKIGQVLLEAEGPLPERQGEIGWHLLRGGDELRGAELLARAGGRLFHAGSFYDAAAPLEAALAIFDREGRAPAERLEIAFMLLQLGFLCRRELVTQYAEGTLSALEQYSGLSIAGRLRRALGRKLSIILGIAARSVIHIFTREKRRGPNPARAFEQFLTGTNFMVGVAAVAMDFAWLERLVRSLEPIDGLWPGLFKDVYTLARMLQASPLGRLDTIHRLGAHMLQILENDRSQSIETKLAEGAIRTVLALHQARDGTPACLEHVERLERIGLFIWEVAAKHLRGLYHSWRGELEKAKEIGSTLELMLVRSGSSWQMEAWVPAAQADAFAFLGDIIGLRREIVGLERVTREGLNYQAALDRTRGEYQRARGEYELALVSLHRALEGFPEDEGIARPATMTSVAETYLSAERYSEAKAAAERALEYMRHPERAQKLPRLCAERILALADAMLGDVEAARNRMDAAIKEAEAVRNPALTGLMHDGGARIQLIRGDLGGFIHHLERAATHYWPTKNATLIARWEALNALGQAKFSREHAKRLEHHPDAENAATIVRGLSGGSVAVGGAIPDAHGVRATAELEEGVTETAPSEVADA